MEGLTEGRIVHYVLDDNNTHRPAIVVKVNKSENLALLDTINILVFLDQKDAGFPFQFTSQCIYSEEKRFNTWHWIERQ